MEELIYENQGKQRLDKYLAEEFNDFSRSQIQKLIKDGQILVNNKLVSNHYQLKQDDKVEINKTIKQESIKLKNQKGEMVPQVLYKTDDYLIIDKPAGLIIHPAESVKEPTLVDWLIANYPQIKSVGENPARPGIVHRLDKEVSGIMVIALNQKMFEHLKKQFQDHQVKKEYLALVHGVIEADEGKIDFPMERSRLSGKMVSRPKGEVGRESITEFIVLKRYSRYTFIKVNILTGRTHQIRSHLQAYGYPIIGDSLYKNKKILENLELNRLFLHAHLLRFLDLNKELQEFKVELPSELNTILKNLK